jgi:hypothetical protein
MSQLYTSRQVERLPHSRDPATAWRYECHVSESMGDWPMLRANGFARTEAEAWAKADAWEPRKATIQGLEILISDGADLLRSEACVPELGLSLIIERNRDLIDWHMPAQSLEPLLSPALYGLHVSGFAGRDRGIELYGQKGIYVDDRKASIDTLVELVIADARKQIRAAADAARAWADSVDACLSKEAA